MSINSNSNAQIIPTILKVENINKISPIIKQEIEIISDRGSDLSEEKLNQDSFEESIINAQDRPPSEISNCMYFYENTTPLSHKRASST